MQTILLLSSGKFLPNNPLVLGKPFKDFKMAMVINASKGKGVANTDYMERDKNFFREQGCNFFELDLDGKTENELREILKKTDVVYVEGGSSFYLLKSIRESGFDKVIKELLPQGLIYMGVSAGSFVACPTIEMATWKYQDKYDHYGITDLTAMNLVPFLLSAHYKPENQELLKEKISQASLPVKILNDEQAIILQGDNVKLIGKGEEIKF